jgi:hypothetical protein
MHSHTPIIISKFIIIITQKFIFLLGLSEWMSHFEVWNQTL